jgi:hypothetical protein
MRFASATRYAILALALIALIPGESIAQDGYMLQTPRVSVILRGGASMPIGPDALRDSLTSWLTLDRRDFAALTLGAELAVLLTPRLDIMLGYSRARSRRGSEFRDWMDADSLPIEQTTSLERNMLAVGGRFFLNERGHSAGKLAWVPSSFLPYVGGGAGVLRYTFVQQGWFVDFETRDIFLDFFSNEGTTPLVYGSVGSEWWLAPRVGLTAEARYTYARATLGQFTDFPDFADLDLSGVQMTAGIAIRF